jgi:hypothetical protein
VASIKVWKRTGAVAVYSPVRFALTVLVLVLAVAAAGFFGGRATRSTKTTVATVRAPAPPATASTAPAKPAPAPTTPVRARHAVRRSFQRGYRAGARSVFGSPSFFVPGSAYLVKVAPGGNGARYSLGPRVKVQTGFVYRLCRGGTKICVAPDPRDGRPAAAPAAGSTN